MRVLHVISGISPQSGGPTRSVKGLCRALSQHGIDVSLLVLRGNDIFDNPCGVKVFRGVCADIGAFDVVHIHGLWDLGLHAIARECRKLKVPYIISPRGMLDPWALSVKKWKKRLALFLYQRLDLKQAAAFHATAQAEKDHITANGFLQPCFIAPNAVDLPATMPPRHCGGTTHTALFLSRLHPGKGLITLVEAWNRIRPVGWRMKIVGPDSYGHKADVVARLKRLGVCEDWDFYQPLNDSDKWLAYRSADLLIHPSVSENFGITIAEGLAAELPVIATKGTPWQELEDHRCGWWIETGIEPLARALQDAISLTNDERRLMGVRGCKLVEGKYTWSAVVKNMLEGYANTLCKAREGGVVENNLEKSNYG